MVAEYHDGTKHHFHAFARSLGYLDWASQPDPFRSFHGAHEIPLPPRPDGNSCWLLAGDLLRHSFGLSAWKQWRPAASSGQASRWPLRVNPSSGNLHPTEAYVVDRSGVYHYAADRHALEQRCAADFDALGDTFLIALTSIHWREAWKYGERAFRYCQHDLGHAIGAVSIAAALAGRRATLLPDWSHRDIASLTGIDRDEDYVDAEREEPGCVLGLSLQSSVFSRDGMLSAVGQGTWTGRASQLSEDHVQWTFIDAIARATNDPGRAPRHVPTPHDLPGQPAAPVPPAYTRRLLLQRRSALALDARSSIDGDRFLAILERVMPSERPPWDALWWDARVHLALFVHRVDGFDPGLYVLVRSERAFDRLKASMVRDFAWERATDRVPLFLLARGDCRRIAARVSCDQEIAADGFFSLGMIADFDGSLEEFGPSFYRHLYWECGVVGQVLYLEAEAAGARGTGIGCFYDDPMHDVLGLSGHAFQDLYHFTIGVPVDDARLTSEPGYAWERSTSTEGAPPLR